MHSENQFCNLRFVGAVVTSQGNFSHGSHSFTTVSWTGRLAQSPVLIANSEVYPAADGSWYIWMNRINTSLRHEKLSGLRTRAVQQTAKKLFTSSWYLLKYLQTRYNCQLSGRPFSYVLQAQRIRYPANNLISENIEFYGVVISDFVAVVFFSKESSYRDFEKELSKMPSMFERIWRTSVTISCIVYF